MFGGVKGVVEYALARTLLDSFRILPRRIAQPAADTLAWIGFHIGRRQRAAGLHNLRMAFPDLSEVERTRILRGCYNNLSRLLVEFSHFPSLDQSNIGQFVIHEGLEH